MDKKALQLLCRFALPPNSLGYCGRGTAPEKFKACILRGKCEGVEEELSKFIVLNPYLEMFKNITGQNKYAYAAAEAYWLGGDTLKKAKVSDYKLLLKFFAKQGVPDWLVEDLKKQVPKKFVPLHLFQVLHVGVGRASGAVPYNPESINNCMVRWGTIKKIENGGLSIENYGLERKNKKYVLARQNSKVAFREDFLPGVKVGDTVAVHWGQAVKKLTPGETANLEYWTRQVLEAINGPSI